MDSKYFKRLEFTSTLRKGFLLSLTVGLYSLLPLVDFLYLNHSLAYDFSTAETVLGLIIGLMLLFRANRCYERWWEARSLWGNLIGLSRNLAIKTKSIINLSETETTQVAEFIIGFSKSLKNQLHPKITSSDYKAISETPTELVDGFYLKIKSWRKNQTLSTEELWIIDQELRNFLPIVGGCEKIKNTLVPKSFRNFSNQIVLMFILALPWIFVNSLGYLVIVFSIIFSYLILGIEEIAHSLETPFGDSEDHLDLIKLTEVIEKSTREILD